MNNLLYDINESPRSASELIVYSIQQVFAVFVATVLIATICGTPISACLVGAGIATILYQFITKFRSPIFISSCGATCGAVISAMALAPGNYSTVIVGGLTILAVYAIVALIVKWRGMETINRWFPPVIVGTITIVIGANLATFIPTYVSIDGAHSNIATFVAIVTMIAVAVSSHYFKGFWKTIPFLIGLFAGYIISIPFGLVDFSVFTNLSFFSVPDFTFEHLSTLSFATIGKIILIFAPVALAAIMEHYSDHKVLSNIIGHDLTTDPGLHRTLLGDGFGSLIGTIICGLPNTSYGESIATVGFSRVASIRVLTTAAIMLIILGFIAPIQAFI
ncbi:MAG: solute carrier family 23 protein, partial [Prevotellaceae bacterium]|nr:solute carrier family 23 protein [Prevotellaceae bacterium]